MEIQPTPKQIIKAELPKPIIQSESPRQTLKVVQQSVEEVYHSLEAKILIALDMRGELKD